MSKTNHQPELKERTQTPEQLALLSVPVQVPSRFVLDDRTRRSGLAHVAALRAQLSAQASSRDITSPVRRHHANIAA